MLELIPVLTVIETLDNFVNEAVSRTGYDSVVIARIEVVRANIVSMTCLFGVNNFYRHMSVLEKR
jgi:hypothetical protein